MSGRTKAERNTVGKRVGGARYYHKFAIQWSNPNSQKAIEAATQIARLRSDAFNVVKIEGEPVNGGVIMRWSGGVRMYHWHGGSLSA